MERLNTFVFPLVRTDLIRRCLETLYRYTPPNFYVYVIDQSVDGIEKDIIDKYVHQYIRPYRNLGFAKATNTGVKLAETKYVTTCNDDVEFIHPDWYDGVMETFDDVAKATPDRPAVLVNPASIRLPGWSIGREEDFDILSYRENFSDEDWRNLVDNEHVIKKDFTIQPGTVIDGVTMFCSVMHRERFLECEMLDSHFAYGGGEDYDFNCRANLMGYRSVGTTKSWVWHHWGMCLKNLSMFPQIDPKMQWNNNDEKWGKGFSVWGLKCTKCNSPLQHKKDYGRMLLCPNHPEEKYEIPQNTEIPL